MKFTIKFILLCLLLAPCMVFAETTEQLQADFAVIEGVVVMPLNHEYIVTMNEQAGLNIGDILTVVRPDSKIFHPETKEVIGTIEKPLGYLQVVRIQSGYAYARVLTEGFQPVDGAPLKRYEQVPAQVVTGAQANPELVRQLQRNLPQFKWLSQGTSDQALVSFILDKDELVVRTAQDDTLHWYAIDENQQLVRKTRAAPRPYLTLQEKPEPRLLQRFANSVMGTISETNEERFSEIDAAILRNKQADELGLWLGPNIAGQPVGIVVGDFDGDSRQEVAVALEKQVLIGRIEGGEYTTLAELAAPPAVQVYSIDALDLDGNGLTELYLTGIAGTRPSSFVVNYSAGNYQIDVRSERRLLRVLTLPGEPAPVLAGQRLGSVGEVFYGDVLLMQREGDELVEGDRLALPEPLNLFNFLAFTGDRKQLLYAYLSDGDFLKVIDGDGQALWTSSDYFGGSENCFFPETDRRDEVEPLICFWPRMIQLPDGEILVTQNQGQRMVQRFKRFSRSRVVSLSWNGVAFNENWRAASQPGYLADFDYADADNDGTPELVMLVKFQHAGLTDKARSSIVIYELE